MVCTAKNCTTRPLALGTSRLRFTVAPMDEASALPIVTPAPST